MVNFRKDIATFLKKYNIPTEILEKKDVLDKSEIKVADILGHDKKINRMSDVFPSSGNTEGKIDFLS